MLKVQEYLKTHCLNELIKDHGVYHTILNHKVSLNYDQIEAKENDPLSQDCRGTVLCFKSYPTVTSDQLVGETDVLALPFKRFFNYGTSHAGNIDLNKCSFYDKLDGTCIIFYHDFVVNKWCVATRSHSEANIPILGFPNRTFTTLFQYSVEKTTNLSYNDWLQKANLNKDVTHIFELTTPENRIVVDYKEYKVTLIGLRNNKTHEEYDIKVHGPTMVPMIPICSTFNVKNTKELVNFVSKFNPLQNEGIVVCDHKFRRVKVKNPAYVAYNRIADKANKATTARYIMQIVLDEKLDDLSQVLPEYVRNVAYEYQDKIRELFKQVKQQYEDCLAEVNKLGVMSDKVKQKQYVLIVQKHKFWLAPIMEMYYGKIQGVHQYVENQRTQNGEYKNSLLDFLIDKCIGV